MSAPDLERLFTGSTPVADVCDPCGREIPAGQVRVIYAATATALVTCCGHCHIKRLAAPLAKVWHTSTGVTRG